MIRSVFIFLFAAVALFVIWTKMPSEERSILTDLGQSAWDATSGAPELLNDLPEGEVPELPDVPEIPDLPGSDALSQYDPRNAIPPTEGADAESNNSPTPESTNVEGVSIRPDDFVASAPYDRSDYRHWDNHERSCWTVREQALLDESLVAPTLRDVNGRITSDPNEACEISSGLWWNAYAGNGSNALQDPEYDAAVAGNLSGNFFSNPSDLDLDHLVPLADAHRSGGFDWDSDTKRDFANWLEDDYHLIAVAAADNRRKSDHPPGIAAIGSPGEVADESWVPGNVQLWCEYSSDWIAVKSAWNLTVTQDESDALAEMQSSC